MKLPTGYAARFRPVFERTPMPDDATAPDTIVLIHGFWVTPRSWEHWITRYEAKGFRVLAPAYPGFEVEVEALNADPSPIEAVTVPQIIEHLEDGRPRPRPAADPDRPLRRRGVHADPSRPRLRRRRRGDQLRPDRGRQGRPAVADQGDVPRAQEPRQPPQGGRVHVRAVALRLHEHLQRGGVAGALRAVPHSGLRPRSSGEARWRTSIRARTTTTSTTRTRTARRCSSSRAARIT